MSPKTQPMPTFWQLYIEHVRVRGSLLLADATLMVFVVLPPMALALGLKLIAISDVSQASLHTAETIDGAWLVIAVGIICLDSAGKLFAVTVSRWRTSYGKTTP